MDNESKVKRLKAEIPLYRKANLTIEEASAYSGIGQDRLRRITNKHDCEFVLWLGNKRLIKRKLFEQYLERENLI